MKFPSSLMFKVIKVALINAAIWMIWRLETIVYFKLQLFLLLLFFKLRNLCVWLRINLKNMIFAVEIFQHSN